MVFLHYYILGVVVCFLCSLLLEHFYFGNGHAETVKMDMISTDFLYSLLSWFGFVGVVIMFISEWYCGFDQKGVGEKLYKYEEELSEKNAKNKNATK